VRFTRRQERKFLPSAAYRVDIRHHEDKHFVAQFPRERDAPRSRIVFPESGASERAPGVSLCVLCDTARNSQAALLQCERSAALFAAACQSIKLSIQTRGGCASRAHAALALGTRAAPNATNALQSHKGHQGEINQNLVELLWLGMGKRKWFLVRNAFHFKQVVR